MTALTRWVASRPEASIERLKKINHAATSSAHIILALSYGLHDPHIRAINRMIVALLLSRHKAQKCGNAKIEARVEAKLQDLHEAINSVTGAPPTSHSKEEAGNACKRATVRATFSPKFN
jgi:hypothetical protein